VKQLVQSLLFTFGVALVISLPFYPENYWKAVSISVGLQIFIGWVINSMLQNFRIAKETEEYNRTLEVFAQNMVNIPCASCKTIMSIPIFLSEENIAKCERCGDETKIDITLTPILLTKTIDNNVAINEIFQHVEQFPPNKEEQ